MTKANAKAEAPSNEQLMQLILSLKAENEALKAAKPEKPVGAVSITEKGQIVVTFPTGNGFLQARYYAWHWEAILKAEKEIRAACKDKRAMTEAAFRTAKAK